MSYTDKMEFQFEGEVANLTTGEKYKLTDGKPSTVTVRRGDPNTIFMWIIARHSDPYGTNPDPKIIREGKEDRFPYRKGILFATQYQYTWTVDADESGKIYTIGTPREAVVPMAPPDFAFMESKVETDYDKSNTKYVGVKMLIGYGYRFHPTSIAKKEFSCRLLAEKPKEAPKPKIRKETIEVGSFAFGDDSMKKIKPVGKMFDYSKLSAWYNSLPERTRKTILSGKPPGGEKIVCTGYTDNVGDEHLNFKLGTKRAIAVAETLGGLAGVNWKDFVATPSKGEQDNRKEEKNKEKQEPKHRRVEVTIHIEE